jgi:flavin-binding protein dodecin
VVQKVISIVGVSEESFAKAADNAVKVAAKSVRNMKWARLHDLEMGLEGDKVADYRATVRIYFDVD